MNRITVPGNRKSPRGDELMLGGTILAVDILNTSSDGGS
jgi:hypothetical protein